MEVHSENGRAIAAIVSQIRRLCAAHDAAGCRSCFGGHPPRPPAWDPIDELDAATAARGGRGMATATSSAGPRLAAGGVAASTPRLLCAIAEASRQRNIELRGCAGRRRSHSHDHNRFDRDTGWQPLARRAVRPPSAPRSAAHWQRRLRLARRTRPNAPRKPWAPDRQRTCTTARAVALPGSTPTPTATEPRWPTTCGPRTCGSASPRSKTQASAPLQRLRVQRRLDRKASDAQPALVRTAPTTAPRWPTGYSDAEQTATSRAPPPARKLRSSRAWTRLLD